MAKKKVTNWMQELYELNEKELAPGSEFLLSIGAKKSARPKPKKEQGPFTLQGRAAAARKKQQGSR